MQHADASEIVTAASSDVGRVREVNQDFHGEFARPKEGLRLLIVADGLGGHRGGETASRIGVESLGAIFAESSEDPEELLRTGFEVANHEVYEASRADPSLAGMGTTLVAILFGRKGRAWVAHVGDSRAYRLRDGGLVQLTEDHSVVGQLVRTGQITESEAEFHPQRHEILRAIGTQEKVRADVSEMEVLPGDRFLLCSDGLSGMVSDEEIAALAGEKAPERAARALVERANEAGGADNITVQIAAVPEDPSGRGSGARRLFRALVGGGTT